MLMVTKIPRFTCKIMLALLALAPAAAPALAADVISLRLEVYGLARLHVLTLHSQIDELPDRYAITVDYATTGVAGLFVDVKTHAQVRGRLGPSWAQPEVFRNETIRDGDARKNSVDYHPDGTVAGSSTPPPAEPVPLASMRGTVDNLTAYYLLERQLVRTGSCALAVPVFDGRFRYDLFFTDAGQQKLAPEHGQSYDGTVTVCRMRRHTLVPTGGKESGEGARQGTIWYANLVPSAGAMVPVRMEMETQIGSVDGYVAEVHGRGVDLKLME